MRGSLCSLPSGIDGDRDYRDAVRTVVRRMLELLAEYVRIDLLILEPQIAPGQARAQDVVETVDAFHDRRTGVEQETSAGREPVYSLLDDLERQLRSELAAAVPIGAQAPINEVRRIGDDEIEHSIDSDEKIALDDVD